MQNVTSRIREIYCHALECETDSAREAYVNSVCGDDSALKKQVIELLDARSEVGEFLGGTAQMDGGELTAVGTSIGPYKLREKIGEGGFGVVYVAEQKEPVSRKVALKIIKPGMDSKDIIARFEAERQALAMMDHPNVAKVLDAGATESGRPYFVMELVHGVAITEYCDSKKLTNRQRLDLFINVCHAVQHAHQKGLIHRDLKPTNIMVTKADHRAVVKVIDFGVAKALHHDLTDKSIYTGYGQVVGTPMYMSPEQAELSSLDVDTRSDIYSLGVLLYELLTGTTPFDKETFKTAGFDEVRRLIREVEPRRPSEQVSTLKAEQISTISESRSIEQGSLSKALRGDLDWIVMKALEKDRTRRHETANALADDIQRYLDDEPVMARPPSTQYKIQKFARRNKVGLAFASLTALFLLAGVTGLAISNYVITKRGNETLAALEKADENFRLAKRDGAIADNANEFINTLLGKANPHEQPDRGLTVSEVLDEALVSLDSRFDKQPLVEAGIRETIAEALNGLGRYDEERRQREIIRIIYQRELGSEHRKTLENALGLIWNAHDRNEYKVALNQIEPLYETIRTKYGDQDELTLRVARGQTDLLRHCGELKDSETQLREVLSIHERKRGTELQTLHMLALTLADQGKYAEAEELRRRILSTETTFLPDP